MPQDVTATLAPDFARYRVEPGEDVDLADHDTADTGGFDDPAEARAELIGLTERIADLQARLYAEEERGLLVVLQGIDAAGKDSTVKHVFSGVNPQGCRVYSFREPSSEESGHDFLWRYHRDTPARGMIHVFHRSH
jgi:polyphosphate kinase 2 (PPK2 family)